MRHCAKGKKKLNLKEKNHLYPQNTISEQYKTEEKSEDVISVHIETLKIFTEQHNFNQNKTQHYIL